MSVLTVNKRICRPNTRAKGEIRKGKRKTSDKHLKITTRWHIQHIKHMFLGYIWSVLHLFWDGTNKHETLRVLLPCSA